MPPPAAVEPQGGGTLPLQLADYHHCPPPPGGLALWFSSLNLAGPSTLAKASQLAKAARGRLDSGVSSSSMRSSCPEHAVLLPRAALRPAALPALSLQPFAHRKLVLVSCPRIKSGRTTSGGQAIRCLRPRIAMALAVRASRFQPRPASISAPATPASTSLAAAAANARPRACAAAAAAVRASPFTEATSSSRYRRDAWSYAADGSSSSASPSSSDAAAAAAAAGTTRSRCSCRSCGGCWTR